MPVSIRAPFPAANAAATSASSTTVTQSVTVQAGDALEAHVVVSSSNDGALNVTCAANGVGSDGSSAEVHSNGQTAGFEQVFYWVAPATGTYNVVATVTGGTPAALGLKCYAITGHDGNAPSITTFAPSGTGTLASWRRSSGRPRRSTTRPRSSSATRSR